jgi:hypothetical protein
LQPGRPQKTRTLAHGKAEFTGFLETAFHNAADVSIDGAIHYQCMDWRHIDEMKEAREAVYSELKNLCIGSNDNAGMESFYLSRHELIFVRKVGSANRRRHASAIRRRFRPKQSTGKA